MRVHSEACGSCLGISRILDGLRINGAVARFMDAINECGLFVLYTIENSWVGPKPLGLEESFVILEELSSCNAAHEIWKNMLSPSTFSFSQNWTVAEWIENNYCNMAHVDGVGSWATFFYFLLWGFWKPRNDVVFRRRKKETRLIVCKAREQTIEARALMK
nr:uncharacterized protein LOC109164864 [Ipomoea batatas]